MEHVSIIVQGDMVPDFKITRRNDHVVGGEYFTTLAHEGEKRNLKKLDGSVEQLGIVPSTTKRYNLLFFRLSWFQNVVLFRQ